MDAWGVRCVGIADSAPAVACLSPLNLEITPIKSEEEATPPVSPERRPSSGALLSVPPPPPSHASASTSTTPTTPVPAPTTPTKASTTAQVAEAPVVTLGDFIRGELHLTPLVPIDYDASRARDNIYNFLRVPLFLEKVPPFSCLSLSRLWHVSSVTV